MYYIKSLLSKLILVFSLVFLSLSSAFAGDVVNVNVGLHQAELVKLPKAMTHVIIADRSIAGVVKHASTKVSVIGHGIGKTDIRFMNGKRIVRQVNLNVYYDLPKIKKTLHSLFPKERIGLEMVNGAVAITGMVSNAETAARVVRVVEEYTKNAPGDASGTVLNLMKLISGQQVMLRVRVGELKRSELKRFGLGLHGIISAGHALFGALENQNTFRVLAEPTLTAISGETAQFLAGGEFPVPIAQSGNTMSVDYKSFGVSVDFTPVVLSENRIRLDVASEVSELKKDQSVHSQNMIIPSISTRRANTTVELAPGESFMIAGLIKDRSMAGISEVPGLGDIPVLNALFRSAEFKKNETELVIAVTPYLADPVKSDDIRLPGEDYKFTSMMEMMFLGRINDRKQAGGLEGPVGYIVD